MNAVVLAGGTGTRLWPLSRSTKPKQFERLTSDKTMFEETIERISFFICGSAIGLIENSSKSSPTSNKAASGFAANSPQIPTSMPALCPASTVI